MLEKNSKVIFEDESNFAASEVARNFIQNRKTKCKIKGIGSYFPNKIVTNNDLITNVILQMISVASFMGFVNRYFLSNMACKAYGFSSLFTRDEDGKAVIKDERESIYIDQLALNEPELIQVNNKILFE